MRARELLGLGALLLVLAGGGAALTLVMHGSRASSAQSVAPVTIAAVEDPVVAPVSPPRVVKPLRVPKARSAARRGRATPAAVVIPHQSRAIGRPNDGRLEGGVVLPASGPDHFAWGPDWRRVGTDTLVVWLQGVLRYFRAKYPGAPRIGITDLSLPHGGPFGREYGGLGHASHQNGLDVDVMYPRLDRAERPAARVEDVDRALSQALVDTFVAAGARFAFVGQHVGLTGPAAIVQAIPHHDDHVHVRISPLN